MIKSTPDKDEILSYANEHGVTKAAEYFGIKPTKIYNWRSKTKSNAKKKRLKAKLKREADNHTKPIATAMVIGKVDDLVRLKEENKALKALLKSLL